MTRTSLTKRAYRQLHDLIIDLGPRRRLFGAEIGVDRGQTSARLLRDFPQLRLQMVDNWGTYIEEHPYRRSGDSCASRTEQEQEQAQAEAELRTAFAVERREIVVADSVAAACRVQAGSLDFVFVDGAHHYEGVIRDLRAWWPRVRPDGLFCGHDYAHPRDKRGIFGVARAVHEFAGRAMKVEADEATQVWWFAPKKTKEEP